jgi:DNA-3-methyladenine glycosylase II
MIEITLKPRPPYDFHASLLIFAGGDPAIRTYENGIFRMALETGDQPVRITIRSSGTVSDPVLSLGIEGDRPVSKALVLNITDTVRDMLSLDEDLLPMYTDLGGDPVLSPLFRSLYGLKSPVTPTVFEALIDSVIEQQISLSVAYQLEHRLIKQTGTRLIIGEDTYYCYPTASVLARTPLEVYRSCGLTIRKSEYIRGISELVTTGKLDLEAMQGRDTDEIIERLCSIRGIGTWTAELTMLRGFHRYDAFPAADIALRRMISNLICEGRKISAEEARTIAEPWGRWRGLVAFYLEVGERMEGES